MAQIPTQSRMNLAGNKSAGVNCLGMTFADDNERRSYFQAKLRELLTDPTFRNQGGFPIGSDDEIIEMSDPPYYTVCPNPWLTDFINNWGNTYRSNDTYSRKPMTIDVSEGKTDPIYTAHSYHTKVPHLAIVPSILHYTEPGDIVLDAFSGSGMTGVAAQWCGTAPSSYRQKLEMDWKNAGISGPKWGDRRVVLNDLSPAATFISANYNLTFDIEEFAKAGKELLRWIDIEFGWMYETLHSDGKTKARIEYTVWSDVLNCSTCGGEFVFAEVALDEATQEVADIVCCPHCGAEGTKEQMDLRFESVIDQLTGTVYERPKRVPVRIQYRIGKIKYNKHPDPLDLQILAKASAAPVPSDLPTDLLPDCQMTRVGRMRTTKTTAVNLMFLPRSAQAMAFLWRNAKTHPDHRTRLMLKFFIEQGIRGMSILNRYKPIQHGKLGGSQVGLDLSGVFYVPSIISEVSPWAQFEGKLDRLVKTFSNFSGRSDNVAISTEGASNIKLPDNSIDYIFTDPPFGENIYYADLNYFVESWHGVKSNVALEAIVDRVCGKGVPDYQVLMQDCFSNYYRILKPGRWMTVVFSNSRASVWNAIQVSLQQSGFVVAEVTALDKKQGSFQQGISPNAVKQDLVISCYKPNGGLEERFNTFGVTAETAWDFVGTHLKNLAVFKIADSGQMEVVAERDPRRIFDRMVAWFVRHNAPVPVSNAEFQDSIIKRFPERDGMIFLPDQLDTYDRQRLNVGQAPQRELFVDDERSAIDWLTDFLRTRPSTYQEVHPEFTRQIGAGWRKYEMRPELTGLLDDNFLRFSGNGPVPAQIHAYLSSNWKELRNLDKSDSALIAKARDRWYLPDPAKQQDVEKKREKALLKDFERYLAHSGRKLREVRLEVLRAGFKAAWASREYRTIIDVADKIAEDIWQEDEKLLTFYDMAETRLRAGR